MTDLLKDAEQLSTQDRERRQVAQRAGGGELLSLIGGRVSPAMQVMLNDQLFDRARLLAKYLAEAEGFVPKHLKGKTSACFAVVTRALTWKLDPFAVAQSTYETPNGNVGFEGKLIQAIIENSGMVEGGVEFHHYGDWSKLVGKFEIATGDRGGKYAKRLWTVQDAQGLGVVVKAKIRGEEKKREFDFKLVQAWPLNSTLWATDPKTQICYTAVRRFGSVVVPGLLMGVPFDMADAVPYAPGDNARSINADPEPQEPGAARGPTIEPYAVHDARGERLKGSHTTPDDFAEALAAIVGTLQTPADKLAFFSSNMQEIERCIAEHPHATNEGSVLNSLLTIYEGAEFDVQSEGFRKAEEEKPTTTTVAEQFVEDQVEERQPEPERQKSDTQRAGEEDDFPGDRPNTGNVVPLHDRATGEVHDEKNPPPTGADLAGGSTGKDSKATKKAAAGAAAKKADKPQTEEKPKQPTISEEELKRYRVPVPNDDGVPNWMKWCFTALEEIKAMATAGKAQREFMIWREANRESMDNAAKRNKTAVTRIEAELKKGEAHK